MDKRVVCRPRSEFPILCSSGTSNELLDEDERCYCSINIRRDHPSLVGARYPYELRDAEIGAFATLNAQGDVKAESMTPK